MSLTIAPNTTLPQTDFDGIARALRHLRYVSQHASPKLDQPERYELGEAVKLLRSLIEPPKEPAPIGGGSQELDIHAHYAADPYGWYQFERDRSLDGAIDAYLLEGPDPSPDTYEAPPAEFVQPQAPWYLGLDGALFYVPDFPAVDIDAIAF